MAQAMEYAKTILTEWTEEQLLPVCDSVYQEVLADKDVDDRSPKDAMIDEFDCWTD